MIDKSKMEDKRLKIKIKNKSSVTLHGLPPGKSIAAEADKHGTPLDKHWRRRLRDDSVEVIKEVKKIKTKEDK